MNNQEKLFIVKCASALGRRAIGINEALTRRAPRVSAGNHPISGSADLKKYTMSEADKLREYELQGSGGRGNLGSDLDEPWWGTTMRSQKKSVDGPRYGDKRPRDIPGHPHYEGGGKPSIESLGGYDSLRELVERAIRLGYIKKESPVGALMKL